MIYDFLNGQTVRIIRSFMIIANFFLIGAILISCNFQLNGLPFPTLPKSTDLQNTPSVTVPQTQDTKTPVITTPTLTQIIPQVVLIIPSGADLVLAEQLQTILRNLAVKYGLLLEIRNTFTVRDLNPNIKIIVSLPPDPGLVELAVSAQETQFLGINIPGLEPSTNLSVIGSLETSQAERGFLAGYIAAAVTYEWRVGVIGVSDTREGLAAQNGYINGVIYFCGLCKQLYPPFNIYPMYSSLPSTSNSAEWQAAADTLISNKINTIYIVPGAGDQELLIYLADAGINIIGNSPPPDSIKDHWITSIGINYSEEIEKIWDNLMNNKSGVLVNTIFSLNNSNTSLFSTGKQNMVMEFMDELMSGMIDTGVKP